MLTFDIKWNIKADNVIYRDLVCIFITPHDDADWRQSRCRYATLFFHAGSSLPGDAACSQIRYATLLLTQHCTFTMGRLTPDRPVTADQQRHQNEVRHLRVHLGAVVDQGKGIGLANMKIGG